MKKMLAMILALAMVLSMSVFAFAAEEEETVAGGSDFATGSANEAVKVEVTGGSKVYHVVVVWGNLTFTYNKGTWQPESHTYDGIGFATEGTTKLMTTSKIITVYNHSNAQVNYVAAFDGESAKPGVEATLSGNTTATLANAEGTSYADAPKNSFTVTVEVTNEDKLESVVVATIKVTITP